MAKRPGIDAETLAQLIAAHGGNLSAITGALHARGIKITRQGIAHRLERLGLADEAAIARAAQGLPGPRTRLRGGVLDAVGERQQIADALKAGGRLEDIAAALGMSRRQLGRRCQVHGLRLRATDR